MEKFTSARRGESQCRSLIAASHRDASHEDFPIFLGACVQAEFIAQDGREGKKKQ